MISTMMEKEKCYKRDQEGGGGKIVGRSEKGGVLGDEIYQMRRGHAREALSWEKHFSWEKSQSHGARTTWGCLWKLKKKKG